MTETDYQRAWRERGEAEAALRKWNRNQSSPGFSKPVGTIGGLLGAAMLCTFIREPAWSYAPMLLFAAMFYAMPFLSVLTLRDEAKARKEAWETLVRLGVWQAPPQHVNCRCTLRGPARETEDA